MTVEFFGVRGFGQLGGINKTSRPGDTRKTDKAEKDQGAFSTALEGASEVQASAQTADPERAARIEALKEQVAAGTYEPDLNRVASSLLKFLVEG